MNYIPLYVKSHYEILSSLIKIDDLIKFAVENNVYAIGLTDTNMFGTIEFFNGCKKNNIKPIIGVYFEIDELSMILYAKNYDGYVNLLNLVSIRNTSELNIDLLKEKKDSLICVTKDYKNYLDYKEIYEEVFLMYENKEEKINALTITDKIVYIKENLYFNENDKEYLKYLYLIKDGKTINDIDTYNFNNAINVDIEENDAKTTINFASMFNLELPITKFKMPTYSSNSKEELVYLCNKGLNKRLNGVIGEVYKERLDMELKVIIDMDFTDYFLIVYDFILYAKKNGIVVGPGRGSAAGSLVSYSLGITEIDPIKYDLIFERFLNKDRISLPDIDVDIEYLRRDEVINYVKNKYGIDKVANVIAFGTLLPKQVLRDVARVLNMNSIKVERLTKTIKDEKNFSELKNNKLFVNIIRSDEEYTKLIRISSRLEGLKRHTTIHAAGVVIGSDKLMNHAPIYKSGETLLVGYDKDYLEQIGLLKIDFLAIKNLTIIDNIIKLIEKNEGIRINLNKIPFDDIETIELFKRGKTLGIFQFESAGMINFLKRLKVDNFDTLVSAIALYRPGPMDNIPEFIRVKEGKSKAIYIIPKLEKILSKTNGIIIYQEQILEILKTIGGFTYSEADNIRRAMSKKKEDIIASYRKSFVLGALKNEVSEEDANKIYDLVVKFAEYGFNKSHSVAYSFIAFQMGFLKAHFKAYFIITLLNNAISSETKTKEYIDEAKRFDLEFNYLNINEATDLYTVKNNKIIIPLTIIKSIGKEAVKSIIEERTKGLFINYVDFIQRCYNPKVNKGVIENLIYSGSLDIFNLNRHTMIDNLEKVIEYATLCKELDKNLVLVPEIEVTEEYDDSKLLELEVNTLGFYIKNHPATKYKNDKMCPLNNVSNYFNKVITCAVLIEKISEIKTKNNEKMAFITISDEVGKATLVTFPKVYEKNYSIKKGDIIIINARVERRLSEYQLIAISVQKV